MRWGWGRGEGRAEWVCISEDHRTDFGSMRSSPSINLGRGCIGMTLFSDCKNLTNRARQTIQGIENDEDRLKRLGEASRRGDDIHHFVFEKKKVIGKVVRALMKLIYRIFPSFPSLPSACTLRGRRSLWRFPFLFLLVQVGLWPVNVVTTPV